MLRYTTDRARPGLVALYDIRPGNGAGQFLQPRSPHGANRNVGRTDLCGELDSVPAPRETDPTHSHIDTQLYIIVQTELECILNGLPRWRFALYLVTVL